MSDIRVELILDFQLKRLSLEEFLSSYGLVEARAPDEVNVLLVEGAARRSASLVDAGVGLGWLVGFPANVLERVHELLPQSWHMMHESMIGLIQDWRSRSSVNALCAAIELKPSLEYLEYDDYGSYYNKCLWALAAEIWSRVVFEACGSAHPCNISSCSHRILDWLTVGEFHTFDWLTVGELHTFDHLGDQRMAVESPPLLLGLECEFEHHHEGGCS